MQFFHFPVLEKWNALAKLYRNLSLLVWLYEQGLYLFPPDLYVNIKLKVFEILWIMYAETKMKVVPIASQKWTQMSYHPNKFPLHHPNMEYQYIVKGASCEQYEELIFQPGNMTTYA